MIKTPKTVSTAASNAVNVAAPVKSQTPIAKPVQASYDLKAYETPEALIKSLTDIIQKTDPVTKEILSSTKVSEMSEVGNCINTIISGGKSLVAATKKKPSFFSSLIGRVKDNVEAVKDQFKTMQDKFAEVSKTLDASVVTEKQNIARMRGRIQNLQIGIRDLKTFEGNAIKYRDEYILPKIEHLKEQSSQESLADLAEANNHLTLLNTAIDDAKRYTILYMQSMSGADQAITTSYTAIYTVTVKAKSALTAFSDSAAQYISAKKTEATNNISKALTDALEEQLVITAEQGKANAIAAAKNATRSAVSTEALEKVSNALVESMEGVNQEYENARLQREADLPRLDKIAQDLENAAKGK